MRVEDFWIIDETGVRTRDEDNRVGEKVQIVGTKSLDGFFVITETSAKINVYFLKLLVKVVIST